MEVFGHRPPGNRCGEPGGGLAGRRLFVSKAVSVPPGGRCRDGDRTQAEHDRIYKKINAERRKKGEKPIPKPKKSFHLSGKAADIIIVGKTKHQTAKIASKYFTGIGVYTKHNSVHVDMRAKPWRGGW